MKVMICLVIVGLCAPARSMSRPKGDPVQAAALKAAEAREAVTAGDFARALASMERAWSLDPDPRYRVQMGTYLYRLGRFEEALEIMDWCLGKAAVDAETRAICHKGREAMHPLVDIESIPAGAHIQVDGAERGVTPARLPVLAGDRRIRLSLEDHLDYTVEVRLVPKETARVAAVLNPISAVDTTASPKRSPLLPWIALGVGTAAGGTAAWFWSDMHNEADARDVALSRADWEARDDAAFSSRNGYLVAGSVAVVALGAAIWLWLDER